MNGSSAAPAWVARIALHLDQVSGKKKSTPLSAE